MNRLPSNFMYSEKAFTFANKFKNFNVKFKVDIIYAQYYMNDEDASKGRYRPRDYAGCLGIGAKDPFDDKDKVLSISFTAHKDWWNQYDELITTIKNTPPNNKNSDLIGCTVINQRNKYIEKIGLYKKEGFDELYQFAKKYNGIITEEEFCEFSKNNVFYETVTENRLYDNDENLIKIEEKNVYVNDPFLLNITLNIIVSDMILE
jgi:hypothetical protein